MTDRISTLAGKPVPASLLVNIPRLVTAFFALTPDPAVAAQRVAFGTSGHRGSPFAATFNEAHILAISQAVCSYRRHAGIKTTAKTTKAANSAGHGQRATEATMPTSAAAKPSQSANRPGRSASTTNRMSARPNQVNELSETYSIAAAWGMLKKIRSSP